jgi:hypothetical protein
MSCGGLSIVWCEFKWINFVRCESDRCPRGGDMRRREKEGEKRCVVTEGGRVHRETRRNKKGEGYSKLREK